MTQNYLILEALERAIAEKQLEVTTRFQGKPYVLLGYKDNHALLYDTNTSLCGHIPVQHYKQVLKGGLVLNDSTAPKYLQISHTRLHTMLADTSRTNLIYVFHRYVGKLGVQKDFLILDYDIRANKGVLRRLTQQQCIKYVKQYDALNAKVSTTQGIDILRGINGAIGTIARPQRR